MRAKRLSPPDVTAQGAGAALLAACLWPSPAPGAPAADEPPRVDFAREVRPILADRCFACHGPDAERRKADLRLDTPAGARALVPGEPDASELYRRIASADPDERMPPPDSGKSLAPEEIEVLRRWIAEGAEWTEHWSFVPPRRPSLPAVARSGWPRGPIDALVLARLEAEGLGPAPDADRRTLIRRLSLDLAGLPPTPPEVDAFLSDERTDAYERLVERLLASPRFGERMALFWLDAARYADTNGYSIDGGRHMWLWRDWVVGAFNANKPFDQFTIEQLAGDLLPDATLEQRIASGFNRNHMVTHEGGTIPEEYRVEYVADRVRTTGEVWMGLTFGCARCHDHKYDPIGQEDYYRLFAFFNNIDERGNDGDGGMNAVPVLNVPTPEEARAIERAARELDAGRRGLEAAAGDAAARAEWEALHGARAALDPALRLGPWRVAGPFGAASGLEAFRERFGPEGGLDLAEEPADGVEWRSVADLADGVVHALGGEVGATYLQRTLEVDSAVCATLSLGSDDGLVVWLNGERVLARDVQRAAELDQDRVQVELAPGVNHLLLKVANHGGPAGFAFEVMRVGAPPRVAEALRAPASERSPEQAEALSEFYRTVAAPLRAARARVAAAEEALERAEAAVTRSVMVMGELSEPRATHVLLRGQYDHPGARVEAGTPECLPPLPSGDAGARPDRLALARWLVDPGHPLTARVLANRLWQLVFGRGLVATAGDFGAQGEVPSHPELLDWLALELVEGGWDVKALLRTIVTSATYRQDSSLSPGLRARDPENLLLARGARFRLQAELIRDNALAISGLLVERLGGPSVKPYQPPGLWRELSHFGSTPATAQVYEQDTGDALWRRSLYTYWKRTVPPPAMVAFDAPSREVCTLRRPITNTPLQALVLLNDPTFVEAARALAARTLVEGGATPAERVDFAFRLATARPPTAAERGVLLRALGRERAFFADHPADARALVEVGESGRGRELDALELAAWTGVASLILNLSETITRS